MDVLNSMKFTEQEKATDNRENQNYRMRGFNAQELKSVQKIMGTHKETYLLSRSETWTKSVYSASFAIGHPLCNMSIHCQPWLLNRLVQSYHRHGSPVTITIHLLLRQHCSVNRHNVKQFQVFAFLAFWRRSFWKKGNSFCSLLKNSLCKNNVHLVSSHAIWFCLLQLFPYYKV